MDGAKNPVLGGVPDAGEREPCLRGLLSKSKWVFRPIPCEQHFLLLYVSVIVVDPVGSISFWQIRIRCNQMLSWNILFFPENFNILFKLLKILTPMTLLRKIKQGKLALMWMKVKIFFDFPTCVKVGSIKDVQVSRLQNTRVQTPLSPLFWILFSAWESLCGQSKYFLRNTKEKGVVSNLCIWAHRSM